MLGDLLSRKRNSNAQAVQQVQTWVLDVLQLAEDTLL
jgi:hypothetical protein